jgi:heme-degrading monooxygenase HmoA
VCGKRIDAEEEWRERRISSVQVVCGFAAISPANDHTRRSAQTTDNRQRGEAAVNEEGALMQTNSRIVIIAGLSGALALIVAAFATHAHGAISDATPVGATQARIGRMWHGRVPDSKAAEYYDYLNREGVDRIEKIPGNLGADVMTSTHDGVTEFLVISYWRSLDDIKAYAGADIQKVHNLPRDPEFLIEPESTVRHFVVRRCDRHDAVRQGP